MREIGGGGGGGGGGGWGGQGETNKNWTNASLLYLCNQIYSTFIYPIFDVSVSVNINKL